ncbi:acetyltransferase [Salmonella enterica subsp. houtenae]|nr:acetyltransferase [Salmonella enterica subsp. houtenae]
MPGVGDDAVLYTLGEINIGAHAVISQKGYLCTGSHDYTSAHFDIKRRADCYWRKMLAGDRCSFIAPGVTIGHGTVVGARSSVFKSLPANAICRGNPAVVTRQRVQKVTP